MKIIFFIFLIFIKFGNNVFAQFRSDTVVPYTFAGAKPTLKKTFIPGLFSDPISSRKISPIMTSYSAWNWNAQNNFFWTGAITTQSFNKGKFGTLYYWDVQGNLRGTKGFIDISGKNKRGFKLVFPWKMFR